MLKAKSTDFSMYDKEQLCRLLVNTIRHASEKALILSENLDVDNSEIFMRGYAKGCKNTEIRYKSKLRNAENLKDDLLYFLNTEADIDSLTVKKVKKALDKWSM